MAYVKINEDGLAEVIPTRMFLAEALAKHRFAIVMVGVIVLCDQVSGGLEFVLNFIGG
ncbi:hypothetical protein [Aestuariicoccus sp. MJ-SS9]|uniref:hypothetical protein n=1 Tax=Aestuariicoccus sp. MJ-SS9 TaxID=3079855 RepID=UPI002908C0E9|nr:hypothetical protein [Aestuariicoccus sp. MJ-SS9]MDU8911324.1 hypothetical protein [Aestuariicoccus sp. MJ-SS9]